MIFDCRIVVGSELRVLHCLEDLGFVSSIGTTANLSDVLAGSGSSSPLLAHLIDLLLNDRILSLHGVLDDLGLLHLH